MIKKIIGWAIKMKANGGEESVMKISGTAKDFTGLFVGLISLHTRR